MVAAVTTFFIFKIHPFEIISILVFVFPATVLQPIFESTLKKEFSITVELSEALKN